MGVSGWKGRATCTTIEFYQQPNKGKVRVICRENVTQKLRLNHFLPQSKLVNATLRRDNFVQWSGCDAVIYAEDGAFNNGYCMFGCRFYDGETAKAFFDLLKESVKNNEKFLSFS